MRPQRERPMPERNRLSNLILAHWRSYRPSMVAELESQNRLEEMLSAAEERASDLLYEMISVHKMDHREAWEEAMREVLMTEEPSSTSSPS